MLAPAILFRANPTMSTARALFRASLLHLPLCLLGLAIWRVPNPDYPDHHGVGAGHRTDLLRPREGTVTTRADQPHVRDPTQTTPPSDHPRGDGGDGRRDPWEILMASIERRYGPARSAGGAAAAWGAGIPRLGLVGPRRPEPTTGRDRRGEDGAGESEATDQA